MRKTNQQISKALLGACALGFLGPLGLAGTPKAHASDDPSLVLVRSSYVDELTGGTVRFTGVGVLVKIPLPGRPVRAFVLTSSHLSQGTDLELLSGGEDPLIPAGDAEAARLTDNRSDLELIEIRTPEAPPLARWEEKSRFFVLYPKIFQNWFVQRGWFSQFFSSAPKLFRASATFNGWDAKIFAPHASWVPELPPDSRADAHGAKRNLGLIGSGEVGELEQNLAGSEVSIDAKTVLGMSGTTLIAQSSDESGTETGIIIGLSKSVSRKFSRSFFSKPQQIENLVLRFQEGKRGFLNAVRWKVRNGLLYRDLGENSLEISPTTLPTGGGVSSDGGNSGPGTELSDPYERFQISEGMRWKGKDIIAFRVSDAHPERGLYYANLQTLDLFERLKIPEDQVTPIEASHSFYSLVQERARSYLDKRAKDDRARFLVNSITQRVILNVLRGRDDPFSEIDAIVAQGCKVKLIESQDSRKISVEFGRLFHFELAEDGSLLSSGRPRKGFRPIIEVSGDGRYVVDIRGLASLDPSSVFRRLVESDPGQLDRYLAEYRDRLTLRVEGGLLGRAVNVRCEVQ